jgi:hypothetical protein
MKARAVTNPSNPDADYLGQPSKFPLQNEGPSPFAPPLKLSSHWDPTMILRRTLPAQQVPLPLDFRPYTKVCLEYVTSAPPEQAPIPPANLVFPPGGEFYPPSRYSQAIDQESLLRRQDRPLGTCEADQYVPSTGSDMYSYREFIPPRNKSYDTNFINELSMPRVLLHVGPYHCRAEADTQNVGRSRLMFNNATKQQRYEAPRADPRTKPVASTIA